MATLRLPSFTLALLLAIGSLTPASAGVRLGTISSGAGYGYYSGPVWPGYYPPFFYDPWIGYRSSVLQSIWFPSLTRGKSACKAPIKMQKSTLTTHTPEPLPR